MENVIKLSTCPYCPQMGGVEEINERRNDAIAIELPVTTDEGLKEALRMSLEVFPPHHKR